MREALLLYAIFVTLFVLAPTALEPTLVAMGWWPRGHGLLSSSWNWAFLHPLRVFGLLTGAFVLFLVPYRMALKAWGSVRSWLAPGTLRADEHGFPHREVDLFKGIRERPPGMLFVGLSPEKRRYLPGWRDRLCAGRHYAQPDTPPRGERHAETLRIIHSTVSWASRPPAGGGRLPRSPS